MHLQGVRPPERVLLDGLSPIVRLEMQANRILRHMLMPAQLLR